MHLVAAALLAAATATSLDASSLLPELERFEAVAPCGLPVGRYYTLAKYGAMLSIVGEAAVRDGVVEVAIAARGQSMSVAFYPKLGLVAFGSEAAATKVRVRVRVRVRVICEP